MEERSSNEQVRGDGVVESTTTQQPHDVVVIHDPFSGYVEVPAHKAPKHPVSPTTGE